MLDVMDWISQLSVDDNSPQPETPPSTITIVHNTIWDILEHLTLNTYQSMFRSMRIHGAGAWYSRQLERLNNMPVMGSSLEWTVPSLQGLAIRICGNELSVESLYRPACPRRTLRQTEVIHV